MPPCTGALLVVVYINVTGGGEAAGNEMAAEYKASSNAIKDSRKNNFRFGGTLTLTPALSHRMGEAESSSVGRRIQALWKLRETGLAVPSPVGRERVRVRVVLFEIRLLSSTCFCTNAKQIPRWQRPEIGCAEF